MAKAFLENPETGAAFSADVEVGDEVSYPGWVIHRASVGHLIEALTLIRLTNPVLVHLGNGRFSITPAGTYEAQGDLPVARTYELYFNGEFVSAVDPDFETEIQDGDYAVYEIATAAGHLTMVTPTNTYTHLSSAWAFEGTMVVSAPTSRIPPVPVIEGRILTGPDGDFEIHNITTDAKTEITLAGGATRNLDDFMAPGQRVEVKGFTLTVASDPVSLPAAPVPMVIDDLDMDGGNGAVFGAWTQPFSAEPVTGYDLEFSLNHDPEGSEGNGTWAAVSGSPLDAAAVNHTQTGRTNGTEVYWRLRAKSVNGDAPWTYASAMPKATAVVTPVSYFFSGASSASPANPFVQNNRALVSPSFIVGNLLWSAPPGRSVNSLTLGGQGSTSRGLTEVDSTHKVQTRSLEYTGAAPAPLSVAWNITISAAAFNYWCLTNCDPSSLIRYPAVGRGVSTLSVDVEVEKGSIVMAFATLDVSKGDQGVTGATFTGADTSSGKGIGYTVLEAPYTRMAGTHIATSFGTHTVTLNIEGGTCDAALIVVVVHPE